MQYKIKIESNFKSFKTDLVASSKIIDGITKKLNTQYQLKLKIQDTISTRLKKPLRETESTLKRLNRFKISVPVSITGNIAVKTLGKSFGVLTKGVKSTTKYLKDMSLQLRITEKGMNFLVLNNNFVGGVLSYVATSSADEFIKVEHALNRVRAVAGDTKDQYNLLKNATLGVAESSSLTAREIARGSEILALAGFKTQEIISIQDDLVTSVVNSGESIVTNTENITSSLRVWGTDLSLLTDTVDKLTSGMANAKTTVGELGRGSAAAGNIFKQTGQGTSALISALQTMADQAIKGATAGKGLSTIMQRFAAPTARASNLLNKYSISLVEAGTNAKQETRIMNTLNDTIDGTNDAIDVLSNAYLRGEKSIQPYLGQLESLGIKTRTATGSYKTFNHVAEQLITKNNKAYEIQKQVNEQFDNANRITADLGAELRRLGIDAGLSGGTLKGIIPVAEELAVKFQGISQAERVAFASDLAGKHQAPKLLALINAAEKAKYSIEILGDTFEIYTSKLSLNQAQNDLSTISGRKFATVFSSLGGSVDDLLPAIREFNVQLDHNSKSIISSNTSVDNFIQSILRFKGAGDTWGAAILKATNASKVMSQDTDNLNTVLKKLGSTTEFTDLNSALDELKKHIDSSSDTQVLYAFNSVMSDDMAATFIEAAQNGATYSSEVRAQLGEIIGKSKEMRNSIEDTTQHLLSRMLSTWKSTTFKIGESMKPILEKILNIGIISSKVLGELLPPIISSLVDWMDKFDISAETIRESMVKFFNIVAKVGKGIYDVFITLLDASGASSITFDGIINSIADTLRIFIGVMAGVARGLNWLGLISDTNAAGMESSFNRLDNTFSAVTSNINTNVDGITEKTGYWQQETTKATKHISSDFDLTKNDIFSFGDDVSRSMQDTSTNVSTSSTTMRNNVVDNVSSMRTESTSHVSGLRDSTELDLTTLSQNASITTSSMAKSVVDNIQTMREQSTTHVAQMAVEVPTLVQTMKDNTISEVQGMSQSIAQEADSMKEQTTSKTDEMRGEVGNKITEMKEQSTDITRSFVSDVGGLFVGLKEQVVSEASSMYQQVTSLAGQAAAAASRVKDSIASTISTATSSINDFMSTSSVSEFMNGTSSITESMQNTSINTNSDGLLGAINSGTFYVPSGVTDYDNMVAVQNGADARYLPSSSSDAGIAGVFGIAPSAGHDYEPWWEKVAQTSPDKYQEYVDAGLHNGTYLEKNTQSQTSNSQIIKTQNSDGSVTYSNAEGAAKEQLDETKKTNEILNNVFDGNNFYVSVT